MQGFAVTLAIGVLLSMFSAITVTRSLLRLLVGTPIAREPELLGAGLRAAPAGGAEDAAAAGGGS